METPSFSVNVYRLPFQDSLEMKIVPVPNHYIDYGQQHAIDFCMPIGSSVLAAADGIVQKVVDCHEVGGSDKGKFQKYANIKQIEHSKGEVSGYCHLRKDCLVKEGQEVRAGSVIAYTDITGFCTHPHLHFQIMIFDGNENWTTIPARFLTNGEVKVLRSPKE